MCDGTVIFGGSENSTDNVMGFWLSNGVTKTLAQVVREQGLELSMEGWIVRPPYERQFLSPDGRVLAGNAINPDGKHEGYVLFLDPLVVPEPAGGTLLGIGIAMLGFSRGRKNTAAHEVAEARAV
jgi:hypothetical protein